MPSADSSSHSIEEGAAPPPVGTTLYSYTGHSGSVFDLAWSSDGSRIASASKDGTAQVWNANTGKNIVVYHGHSAKVESVTWSPDSKLVASSSADTTVQIWEAGTGKLVYTYRGHNL